MPSATSSPALRSMNLGLLFQNILAHGGFDSPDCHLPLFYQKTWGWAGK
jgi:hypothetical protein